MAGISGVGVGVAAAGALLVYAGFSGTNPLTALRDIASGNPPAIRNTAGSRVATIANGDPVLVGKMPRTGYPDLLTAVQQFKADHYSQARRWDPGYSDCSSFVGKGFKALGITPPGSSTTWDYLGWPLLVKITQFQAGPGDLLITTSHMAVVVDQINAMGQQNPTSNVRTGKWADIMFPGGYGIYRYSPANKTAEA